MSNILTISRLSDYFILSSLESKETRIVEGANWKGELLSRADESDLTVFNFDSALKNFSFFLYFFLQSFLKKIVTCLIPPPLEISRNAIETRIQVYPIVSFKNFYSIRPILFVSPFSFYSNR